MRLEFFLRRGGYDSGELRLIGDDEAGFLGAAHDDDPALVREPLLWQFVDLVQRDLWQEALVQRELVVGGR
jgi:hypothetical protein